MAEHSKIEWTDSTWNIVTGCSIKSHGCDNCYAMRWAWRFKHLDSREGLTRKTSKGRIVWNGQVRFNAKWLDQPMRWKGNKLIFVCAHGDLFHEKVPFEWLDKIFAVMAMCPQHQFQCLTKRPQRMRDYLRRIQDEDKDLTAWSNAAVTITNDPCAAHLIEECEWPLPNVWLGVSAEDQETAEERVPLLLQTPAAIRYVSAEPLLGEINFRKLHLGDDLYVDGLTGFHAGQPRHLPLPAILARLDWMIVGGESGHGSRPMHPDWARKIRDDCASVFCPLHFKQWGEFAPSTLSDAIRHRKRGLFLKLDGTVPTEAEIEAQFEQAPNEYAEGWTYMAAFGKKHTGRLLDGVEHNGMPSLSPTDIQP